RRGGEIRVATYGDPGTLDPHITTDVPALRIRNQICETLITWDAQTKEAPMLADSWESSADGTVWTFKLRRGVKFHGGQPLPDALIFSFIPDANVRLLSLQQGEVHYIERVLPEQVEQLRKTPGIEVVAIPGTQWSAIYFNFTKGWGQKKEFRQAVSLALNYDE